MCLHEIIISASRDHVICVFAIHSRHISHFDQMYEPWQTGENSQTTAALCATRCRAPCSAWKILPINPGLWPKGSRTYSWKCHCRRATEYHKEAFAWRYFPPDSRSRICIVTRITPVCGAQDKSVPMYILQSRPGESANAGLLWEEMRRREAKEDKPRWAGAQFSDNFV